MLNINVNNLKCSYKLYFHYAVKPKIRNSILSVNTFRKLEELKMS